jgi:hypothetical protein
MPDQLFPLVLDLDRSVFPLAHHHFAFRWRIAPTPSFHLIEAILMPHYPVVPQHSLRLQPEDLMQPFGSRRRQMMVHLRRRVDGEAPVVIITIFLLQILIHA